MKDEASYNFSRTKTNQLYTKKQKQFFPTNRRRGELSVCPTETVLMEGKNREENDLTLLVVIGLFLLDEETSIN